MGGAKRLLRKRESNSHCKRNLGGRRWRAAKPQADEKTAPSPTLRSLGGRSSGVSAVPTCPSVCGEGSRALCHPFSLYRVPSTISLV